MTEADALDVGSDIIERVQKELTNESRLDTEFLDLELKTDNRGTLTLEGEVDSVAAKRLALERAAAVKGVAGIVDRLRVRPAEPMRDKVIRQHFCRALYEDLSFQNIDLGERVKGEVAPYRDVGDTAAGGIIIECDDGVVTLNGAVPSLAHKRLAGVHAWWVPGSRDVVNGIAVEPPEEDGPDRIEEGVRIALEKDPFVTASQIRVGVRNRIVRLTGAVAVAEQRHMAECDAWYVFGVDDVINEIELIS